jgi:hypothetical protein
MRAIKSLVVAAVAAAGVAGVAAAQAAGPMHSGSRIAATGHWNGGGHWRGGSHWGGRYWYPGVGFYIGAPLLWSAWYWGGPYDYYYPRTIVYDRVIERYPSSYPEGVMEPTTEVPRSAGAPAQEPAYRNYCESAKAYYPKVTSCPEGWKFIPAR